MDVQSNCLFITYVEKEGPFLKVWGQTDKNTSLYVEQVLLGFSNQFDNGLCIPHPETLQVGILCCAKYKDNKYYRARITSLDFLPNRYIEVNFVDYGHKDVVPISNIRSLEGFETSFISIPPQASGFLLAEAVCPRGEWNDAYLDEICKEIRYTEVNFSIVGQVTRHYLVRLFVGVNDLAIILISKGLMRHTSLTTQEAVLLSMMPRTPVQAAPQQSIATYKAFTLEPGSQYEVYVSYVTDGPCNFSIQLKQSEEVLGKLMKEINSMTLTPIEGIPIPGTVCLARCMEDGHICRAVVTNEVDGQFKVFYVDFGNFEVISLEALYEIPFKYVIPKVMAIRFGLAGIEKSTVTLEMQCAFKHFVDNRLIHMKVMPMTTRSSLPRCELWDPETQISALDIVNQAASAGYPAHIPLNRGFSQPVKVSYVFSCNRFYVQLKSRQDDLLRLMLDIQVLCREADAIGKNLVRVGGPCYALYEGDQQWYRSQIGEVLAGGQAKVQYVDYGNEEIVPISFLKPIEGKQLTILRPQAIECCLNGYQNMEPDLERDSLLEELILEQEFTMKVVEMQGKKALIELIDVANYNVASLLLEKIAVARSQVSPMLVQAGNKIEHRKTSHPNIVKEQLFKQEQRKPDRAQRQWTDSSGENSTWRQDGRGTRNKPNYETNESGEGNSWRQNNKGFDKNYDRNKRDNDLNDSTDSERHSTKGYNKNDRNRNDMNSRNGESGSWKSNNRGFNKSQDRYNNRDNNRNNDWVAGDEKRTSRDRDEWNGNSNDNQDDWAGGADNQRQKDSKEDDWGGRKNFNSRNKNDWNKDGGRQPGKRGGDDWGKNKERDRRNFNSRETNDWGGGGEKDTERGRQGRDNFGKSRNRSDERGGSWGNNESTHSGGFKKRSDFKRDTSELSSSGSEKSFRKGFKDRNKPGFAKKFDGPPRGNFGEESSGAGDAWGDVSNSTVIGVPNPAPSTAKFIPLDVNDTESNVLISWFHNPVNFYCQLENRQDEFRRLMEDIQQAYKAYPPGSASPGAPVIGLFPEDKVLYRAEILEKIGSQFKVYYVDFGNVSVVDKVWPIEMRFMELPAQAICCKLDGIDPPADGWPDAGAYSQYFDKKQFLCKFMSKDTDRVVVKLEHDNDDITSLLLRDGLAKSLAPAAPPELPLLIGQQFRGMLTSVNSLADFSLLLQSGVSLSCAVFNLSESTETWEDNLKQKVEQILIGYVDELKEDRLEVTLYDETGAKIKLIDRDENAFESVELLCPYLILYSTLSGEVTHVEEGSVFIQPSDCSQLIEYLLNTAYELYENTPVENSVTPVEGYVYAVKGSDTNWYRGRVTSVGEDNHVTVNYLDYGNSEQVEVSELRELAAAFMEMQIMSVAVTVKDASEELIGSCITVDLTFTEAGLEGTIQEVPVPAAPIEEIAVAVTEDFAMAVQSEPPVETSVPTEEVEVMNIIGTQVILSHTDSPSDFYLQLAQSMDSIEQLQATLQTQIAEMSDMENPVVGVLCAAPYSLDQQWYRAQVLDADTDITTVRFVDYGNTDVLDNQTTRAKTLPPNLLSLEVHATRCTLKIKPDDEEWTSAATERFENLCDVELLTAQFITQDEKTNYVDLYSNGTNVREVLIQENLALPDEAQAETSSVGFVSHLNSPSEFWIQLENCVEELEWVAERLSAAESFQELEDLAPGTLCAALFPDDQMWYRARILSNTVAGIEVLFVDYGNSCTSVSLRELPEDLVMLAPLAQKCSLQKPDGLTSWGPEMVRKFSEISADGQTTFNVKKVSTGETASVVLLLDGVDVTTLLLPNTQEVRVKSFEGFDQIFVTKDNEELPNKYKLEGLPDVTWNEESVQKFEEVYDDGKTIFQAEFVSDDTIRLYLGLNDVRLDLNGVKATTPTSSPLKTRSDRIGSNIHSDEAIGDHYHIENIVQSVVESSLNHGDGKELIDDIINHVITNQTESTNLDELVNDISGDDIDSAVNSILTEIVEQSTNQTDFIAESIISDIIEKSTNQTDSIAETIISDIIENSTNQVEALGEGKEAIEGQHLDSCLVESEDSCSTINSIVYEILDHSTNQSPTDTKLVDHSTNYVEDSLVGSADVDTSQDCVESVNSIICEIVDDSTNSFESSEESALTNGDGSVECLTNVEPDQQNTNKSGTLIIEQAAESPVTDETRPPSSFPLETELPTIEKSSEAQPSSSSIQTELTPIEKSSEGQPPSDSIETELVATEKSSEAKPLSSSLETELVATEKSSEAQPLSSSVETDLTPIEKSSEAQPPSGSLETELAAIEKSSEKSEDGGKDVNIDEHCDKQPASSDSVKLDTSASSEVSQGNVEPASSETADKLSEHSNVTKSKTDTEETQNKKSDVDDSKNDEKSAEPTKLTTDK